MERYYYNLAKHLIRYDVEVEIVTSQSDKITTKKLKLDNINFTFIPPNFNKKRLMSIWYFPFFLNVRKYLEETKFDILHGTAGTYPYSELRNRRPVIVQPFGLEPFKMKGVKGILQRLLFYKVSEKNLQNADAIASEGVLQTREIVQLFSNIGEDKIFYLPVGVNLDLIKQYISTSNISRRDYNLQDADIVLINVNRLAPNKGVTYLIEALGILNYIYKVNTKLIIVGSGPEENKIKKTIKDLDLENKVIHLKGVSDIKMFQLYTLADISVTPTLYEGLPTVVLEAMACGKPIVATKISEIPQVVKDGINGLLVPPANPAAIAKAIIEIYDKNIYTKMGRLSRKIVRKYNWSKVAKLAINKYEELI